MNVPGSIYKQAPNALIGSIGTAEIATWDKGNQYIVGLYGSLQGDFSSFRNWIGGMDMDTKQIVWRVFLQPPQDKPTKDWALENCDIGYFVTTPCQTVAQRDKSLLEYDWQAVPGQPPHKLNGVSATWGMPIIDEDTDTMYIATGNQSPYSNLTSRPGPNLYGSSLVAFDLSKGKMKWWVSEYPHDPYDMDCGFYSPMLIEVPGLGTTGKALVKACKDGILNYIDAATGKPLRRFDPITSLYGEKFRANIIYDPAPVLDKDRLPTYNHVTGNWEGFKEMLTLPWAGAGKMEMTDVGRNCAKCDKNNVLLPLGHSGMVGESSTDGAGTIYSFAYLTPEYMKTWDLELASSQGKASWMIVKTGASENGTFYAQDALTGKVKWTWGPFPGSERRMSGTQRPVTGGMVIVSYDGNLAFLDKDTGKQIYKLNLGSQIPTGPSVGKDSAGNSMIVVAVNAGAKPSTASPGGALVGIGLRASSQAKTTTMTTTQTSTSIATSVLTTTSATTATTTVTSTQPAQTQTTTVVSSVTETSGLPSEVTYAAIGVAVIAIAAAAVLVMRKK
ncbi:MAG: hypothetical protein M1503_04665 [Thaumarchaeota archaeon]|nr:hypothetical protein [Nitrososphaerota archaeon]MCL5317543.1 hypothetical protein [Nitrososphaerota archaeon]